MKYWGPSLLVLILGFALAFHFMKPAPPSTFTMATGAPGGAYQAHGLQYQQILARQGVTLELRETAGAMENLALLEAGEVDVAFLQGGVALGRPHPNLKALAGLFLEPVWLFCRGGEDAAYLSGLAGWRIAVGAEGSGTRALAETLLDENGLTGGAVTRLPIGGHEAVAALREGKVDAVFFVMGADAPIMADIIAIEGVRLFPFTRQHAYATRHRFLQGITLGEGALDLAKNFPPEDVPMVAARASLVAHENLHPALVTLLLQTAAESAAPPGMFSDTHITPPEPSAEIPLSDQARNYFNFGPSILQRYLPFWAAVLIDRTKIMLLPLITLLLPLTKIGPPLYVWRTRFKIYRWYRILHAIDQLHKRGLSPGTIEDDINRVRELEKELTDINVPLSYMTEFYDLHIHISYVLQSLEEAREQRDGKG